VSSSPYTAPVLPHRDRIALSGSGSVTSVASTKHVEITDQSRQGGDFDLDANGEVAIPMESAAPELTEPFLRPVATSPRQVESTSRGSSSGKQSVGALIPLPTEETEDEAVVESGVAQFWEVEGIEQGVQLDTGLVSEGGPDKGSNTLFRREGITVELPGNVAPKDLARHLTDERPVCYYVMQVEGAFFISLGSGRWGARVYIFCAEAMTSVPYPITRATAADLQSWMHSD